MVFDMKQVNRVAGISQKYDGTLDYGIVMYDNLPYQRNSDVCNSSTVAMYSGHIIKYYLCLNQEEEYLIDNHDHEIQDILHEIEQEEAKRHLSSEDQAVSTPTSDLTDEQLHALTTDNEQSETATETEGGDAAVPPEQVVNLDDIDDW
jgi:predicted DNA binding protein